LLRPRWRRARLRRSKPRQTRLTQLSSHEGCQCHLGKHACGTPGSVSESALPNRRRCGRDAVRDVTPSRLADQVRGSAPRRPPRAATRITQSNSTGRARTEGQIALFHQDLRVKVTGGSGRAPGQRRQEAAIDSAYGRRVPHRALGIDESTPATGYAEKSLDRLGPRDPSGEALRLVRPGRGSRSRSRINSR